MRRSIVKIISTQRLPDLYQPWTRLNARETGGTGFVIDGSRILTNHHVIAYASQIYIQPHQSAERIAARVLASSAAMDLAILTVEEEGFFDERPPCRWMTPRRAPSPR